MYSIYLWIQPIQTNANPDPKFLHPVLHDKIDSIGGEDQESVLPVLDLHLHQYQPIQGVYINYLLSRLEKPGKNQHTNWGFCYFDPPPPIE